MEDNGYGTVIPHQPYMELATKDYHQVISSVMGISHFYGFRMTPKEKRIYAVPDGSIDLLFSIGSNKVHTYISGTVFRLKDWDMGSGEKCFGVRFQPGKGILPKDIEISMIINRDIEIDGSLFGDSLAEKIAAAPDIKQKITVFQEIYRKHIMQNEIKNSRKNIYDYILKRIGQTAGKITIIELAAETGYSLCYIRRVFKEFSGIAPKQFGQYIRFQNLLRVLGQAGIHYSDAALVCGYYDEAHMIKEFKQFTGMTPQKYNGYKQSDSM